MANSTCISEWKNKIISELQNDDTIIDILDVTDEELDEGLVYNRIFPHDFIPDTNQESKTYITISISLTSTSDDGRWVYPKIYIRIISHQRHMKLNIPTISKSRMDYLSELIDEKFNGRKDFGYDELVLKSNIEDNLNDRFRFRQMIFVTAELNDDLCGKYGGY